MSFPPLFILVGEGRRSSQQIKFRFPRYHELEDLDKLSLAVFDERDNPKDWKETQLHRELCLNEQLGAELNPQFLKIDSERVMSLEGRLQTFPECWPRPLVLEMGLCGFYYKSEASLKCKKDSQDSLSGVYGLGIGDLACDEPEMAICCTLTQLRVESGVCLRGARDGPVLHPNTTACGLGCVPARGQRWPCAAP
ncbi:hypothetical protein BaRGS_00016660 [Batillaria attramentaria]|uniref:Uncharacterized protein n=1 Tax=Batillaria attramentaria TaxID=370345 RepID=A0ABD0KXI5_9CAEN